jgi:hypothetical protein
LTEPMPFKSIDTALQSDVRFSDLCVFQNGVARQMTLTDHHGALAKIKLTGNAPSGVHMAFDRARSTMVYAFLTMTFL